LHPSDCFGIPRWSNLSFDISIVSSYVLATLEASHFLWCASPQSFTHNLPQPHLVRKFGSRCDFHTHGDTVNHQEGQNILIPRTMRWKALVFASLAAGSAASAVEHLDEFDEEQLLNRFERRQVGKANGAANPWGWGQWGQKPAEPAPPGKGTFTGMGPGGMPLVIPSSAKQAASKNNGNPRPTTVAPTPTLIGSRPTSNYQPPPPVPNPASPPRITPTVITPTPRWGNNNAPAKNAPAPYQSGGRPVLAPMVPIITPTSVVGGGRPAPPPMNNWVPPASTHRSSFLEFDEPFTLPPQPRRKRSPRTILGFRSRPTDVPRWEGLDELNENSA
jgi:hypothetical protein